eukprot:TRINITY_DN4682_c0_g2_i11.p1 TRINITY_DN4682_c0_g2~~TRINITY_DN4682_c0_g2_i11.p1  ORF type:complete len:486 (+),score=8.90 TRINITY_DN4682_c0_g2_i11:134-1591(+)
MLLLYKTGRHPQQFCPKSATARKHQFQQMRRWPQIKGDLEDIRAILQIWHSRSQTPPKIRPQQLTVHFYIQSAVLSITRMKELRKKKQQQRLNMAEHRNLLSPIEDLDSNHYSTRIHSMFRGYSLTDMKIEFMYKELLQRNSLVKHTVQSYFDAVTKINLKAKSLELNKTFPTSETEPTSSSSKNIESIGDAANESLKTSALAGKCSPFLVISTPSYQGKGGYSRNRGFTLSPTPLKGGRSINDGIAVESTMKLIAKNYMGNIKKYNQNMQKDQHLISTTKKFTEQQERFVATNFRPSQSRRRRDITVEVNVMNIMVPENVLLQTKRNSLDDSVARDLSEGSRLLSSHQESMKLVSKRMKNFNESANLGTPTRLNARKVNATTNIQPERSNISRERTLPTSPRALALIRKLNYLVKANIHQKTLTSLSYFFLLGKQQSVLMCYIYYRCEEQCRAFFFPSSRSSRENVTVFYYCLLYTSPSPRDQA